MNTPKSKNMLFAHFIFNKYVFDNAIRLGRDNRCWLLKYIFWILFRKENNCFQLKLISWILFQDTKLLLSAQMNFINTFSGVNESRDSYFAIDDIQVRGLSLYRKKTTTKWNNLCQSSISKSSQQIQNIYSEAFKN